MITLLWLYVLPIFGIVMLLLLAAVLFSSVLPNRLTHALARQMLYKGVDLLGPDLMLIRDADGRYTLCPRSYDAENGHYIAHRSDGEKAFDAEGLGGGAMPFLSGSLAVAYEGIGAAADVVSAELGRQAAAKLDGPGDEILADGGDSGVLDTYEVAVPDRKVVDLRNVMRLSPFHVRPGQFERVEENAKKSLQGFTDWSDAAQIGGMLGAFLLGALVVWAFGGGGGSGGSAGESLPMMIGMMGVLL